MLIVNNVYLFKFRFIWMYGTIYSHATFNEYLTKTIHFSRHPALGGNQIIDNKEKNHTIKNYILTERNKMIKPL